MGHLFHDPFFTVMMKFTFHIITQLYYFSVETQRSQNNIAINNKITF